MALLSAPTLNSRFSQLIITAALLIGVVWFFIPSFDSVRHIKEHATHSHSTHSKPPTSKPRPPPPSAGDATVAKPRPDHPIDHLIQRAEKDFAELWQQETASLHDAADAYRKRRGRQPPPHFELWHAFAANHSAVIVESFFDQIYDDLNPFWGVPAKQTREQANTFLHRVSVREGNVSKHTDLPEGRIWIDIWGDMIASIAKWVPDVDIPINVMDESRIVVPWEEINGYMQKEAESRRVVPTVELKDYYDSLKQLDIHPPAEAFDPVFENMGPYWTMAVQGCPPQSPARGTYIETDFSTPPPLAGKWPEGSYMGYVQNSTFARSPCDNPALQGLHGTFVEPISIANSKKFFPLFGGSKLPMNNEILLPPAMYWTDDPFYSGGKEHGLHWESKKNSIIWRGAASGGRNRENNWTRFQRHRFVRMANATAVKLAEIGEDKPRLFVLPVNNSYSLAAQADASTEGTATGLGDWISTWSNAAVVHLLCFPEEGSASKCSYSDPYFSVAQEMPMKEQYTHKYLPDIDGNSFSGRYRAFLYSTSLPIKATIYSEWHDSRLIPWKHFVPMDNTFIDFYGLMEYFFGNTERGVTGHDDVAQSIALGGKAWAEKVLRKEDMQVYVFRLLLEYARLCDDEREVMGWKERGAK